MRARLGSIAGHSAATLRQSRLHACEESAASTLGIGTAGAEPMRPETPGCPDQRARSDEARACEGKERRPDLTFG